MKRIHLLFMILSLSLCATSLKAKDYITYSLTKSDGLSDTYVRDVIQDEAQGCLWFATLNGLNQYDGYTMTNVITRQAMQNGEVPDNRINKIYTWGKNYLWIRLRGNIFACYDLRKRHFVYHTSSNNSQETYKNTFFTKNQTWLYDATNGCMRIQIKDQRFEKKTYTQKNRLLPSSQVNQIIQGRDGYIWIATSKGLVRIDHQGKSQIINNRDDFRCMLTYLGREYFITSSGNVWTYRQGKLYKTDNTQLPAQTKVNSAFPYQDKLIFSTNGKVFEYHIKSHILQESKTFVINHARILSDNRGNHLLLNNDGQVYYISTTYQFHCKLPFAPASAKAELNYKVLTTTDHQVFISTSGKGLYIIDLEKLAKGKMTQAVAERYPTKSNYIPNIYEDKRGNVWVLQEDMGVICLKNSQAIADFVSFHPTASSIDDNHINSIRMLKKANNQKIYTCSINGILATFDGNNLNTIPTQYGEVLSLAIDRQGTYWWGTRQGVYIGNKLYSNDKTKPTSINANKISDILCDNKGRIWLACYGGGLNLARHQANDWQFTHYFTQTQETKEARVLLQDHKGNIWLGTGEGVFVYNPDLLIRKKNKGIHLVVNKNPKMDEIHAILEDSKHRIWVAITGTGVALYDNQGKKPRLVKVFTHADGLGDNNVQSFVEDNQGRIWVGTNYGVSCYQEKSHRFTNYLISYSMLGNRCTENSVCKLADGKLAFGTKKGIAYFYPHHVMRRLEPSQVGITFLFVNGIPLEQLPTDSYEQTGNHFTFNHTQNSIRFKFSDFTFDKEHSTLYSYWLEGQDKEWSTPSNEASIFYRSLPSGNYTFHLRSCNIQGEWSKKETCLQFTILPPFWVTWYAWLLYILVAAIIIYYLWRQVEEKRKLKEKIRLEQQLTDFKVHFFTNISHEFRTPLTIILGAMDNIREKGELPSQLKQPISNMLKSTLRMKRLIDRLLDFTKVQEQKMTLQVEDTEVISFVRDIWTYFQQIAQNKQINYLFSTYTKELSIPVDRNKLDTIVGNLISNALKYTPTGGEVEVKIEHGKENDQLLIHVVDNGIGISEEKRSQLFMRFMQSSFSYDSIGIGLYLSNKMAQLHHGTISYEARPTSGSIFTLHIPSSGKPYSSNEFVQQPVAINMVDEQKEKVWLAEYKETAGKSLNDKQVLIVEDDADVMDFLCQELKRYFIVHTACNGKEAMDAIEKERPDLIVSDVMMPIMNGYELTRKLKTNDTYYDIPIILLTALNEENKKAKGYSAGADDYIEKPFSMTMLLSRCIQLMQQHDKMKALFSQMNTEEPQKVQTLIKEERDKKFIEILDSWIMRHLSDADLNIDVLANSLSYGRSTFYSKVSNLTGMTPNSYIRKKRLEEGKRLLEESNDTIAEISYKTGFSNPYYFTRCFKQEFGMTPSNYRKGN